MFDDIKETTYCCSNGTRNIENFMADCICSTGDILMEVVYYQC
jgi:hypothetical protein